MEVGDLVILKEDSNCFMLNNSYYPYNIEPEDLQDARIYKTPLLIVDIKHYPVDFRDTRGYHIFYKVLLKDKTWWISEKSLERLKSE